MTEESRSLELFRQSHQALLHEYMELKRQELGSEDLDKQLVNRANQIIRDFNTSAVMAGKPQLSEQDESEFRSQVKGLMGGGSLAPLLEREDVENIHILGHDNVVLSLADGNRTMAQPVADSEADLVMMIRHLAATAGHTSRRFDTAAPILDLRLESGHRLFAVTAVAERTSIVIRRHRMLTNSLDTLEELGTLTPQMSAVLRAAVRPPNPANMLVVGGTGSGKTTLLRGLLSEVPQSELVVTIEDTLELHLRSSGLHKRTLALETRTSNTEGTGEITMYDLCKAALRMSPDRVIVGEVRGGEVMQLLQAMGIGNDGSVGTIHAGNTKAAINKILIYAQRSPDSPTPDSVLREIAQVLHLLVFIKKLPDGRRAVTSIREVTGFEDGEVLTSEVFAPGPAGHGVYVRPFKSDGEALARLKIAGFSPAALGEPYRPKTDVTKPPAKRAAANKRRAPQSKQPQPSRRPQPKQPQPSRRPQPKQTQPTRRPQPAQTQPSRRPQPAQPPPSRRPQPAQSQPSRRPQPAQPPPSRRQRPAQSPQQAQLNRQPAQTTNARQPNRAIADPRNPSVPNPSARLAAENGRDQAPSPAPTRRQREAGR